MKRILLALTLALLFALVVVTGVASATHNDQPNPPQDFTAGAGKVSANVSGAAVENNFSFTSHGEDANVITPDARNGQYHVEGTVWSVLGEPTFSQTADVQGRVTCLKVVGNMAYFGGPIEKASDPALVGQFAYFDAVDNDQAPVGGAQPDQFRFEMIRPDSPELRCFTPISGVPITSGNIVVHDGQPNSPEPAASEVGNLLTEAPVQERPEPDTE